MKTPEKIAREIVGPCVFTRFECSPCTPKTDPKCHKCGMVDRIAAAIVAEVKEAEVWGVNAGIVAAASVLFAPHRCVSGSEFECCIDEKAAAIRSLNPAAIVAERTPGTTGFDFRSFAADFHGWAQETFGPGKRTAALSEHIRRELAEIAAEPDSVEEWCDVMLLALNGAMRTGATAGEVAATLTAKLTKNKARTWPDWRTADPEKPIEHHREKLLTTAAIDTTGADLLVVGPKWFRRDGGGEWKEVPRTPHSCQIHRATEGASDCGISPCEEAKVHADRGPPRPVKVRRVIPPPAPAPACARCGGSGETHYVSVCDKALATIPCPACASKP